eukprot:CAMPEP_0172604706 /NCGR_PEP_ID=MMETSP1068-20121228/24961_1 /TAXON_ID=35684 /ORGANISM="Pseudopedinella elastica, Strain CCMP716" /LENGTH=285 /DNA_ID=CAMNT_0013406867 /DNA_START=100 /DNA_END=958 /DNA_ORIENTATION=+
MSDSKGALNELATSTHRAHPPRPLVGHPPPAEGGSGHANSLRPCRPSPHAPRAARVEGSLGSRPPPPRTDLKGVPRRRSSPPCLAATAARTGMQSVESVESVRAVRKIAHVPREERLDVREQLMGVALPHPPRRHLVGGLPPRQVQRRQALPVQREHAPASDGQRGAFLGGRKPAARGAQRGGGRGGEGGERRGDEAEEERAVPLRWGGAREEEVQHGAPPAGGVPPPRVPLGAAPLHQRVRARDPKVPPATAAAAAAASAAAQAGVGSAASSGTRLGQVGGGAR